MKTIEEIIEALAATHLTIAAHEQFILEHPEHDAAKYSYPEQIKDLKIRLETLEYVLNKPSREGRDANGRSHEGEIIQIEIDNWGRFGK